MSNIGKKIIELKDGVTVLVGGGTATVTGPKGTLSMSVPEGIGVAVSEGVVTVKKLKDNHDLEKFFGLTRALLANMVFGVSEGFSKKLELSGVGYRARVEGQYLVLNVGYADPVKIKAPEGIVFMVEENIISVSGISRQLVGDIARDVRDVRVPDPYKAKGIKYLGEHIRRKVGKAAKAVGAK